MNKDVNKFIINELIVKNDSSINHYYNWNAKSWVRVVSQRVLISGTGKINLIWIIITVMSWSFGEFYDQSYVYLIRFTN